jgi:signal peptidase
MKKLFSIITNAVFFVVFVVAMMLVLSTFSVGGWQAYTVLSGSMEPAIDTGSLIVVSPQDSYEEGDIVTRRTNGEMTVTHRIVEKREENGEVSFVTKGDANDAPDTEEISQEMIVGKVVFHISFLGRLVSYAKTQQGFILLIVIPSVLIVYEELKNIGREMSKKWKKKEQSTERDA